jgi:hypothetical protein
MKIQDEVFWVVTPHNIAVGYQCFGGHCCLHLHPASQPRRSQLGIAHLPLTHKAIFNIQIKLKEITSHYFDRNLLFN